MVKYKIEINRDACVGDKFCCEEAPDTFDLDAEGKAVVTDAQGDPPEDVYSAAQGCRLAGIILYDAETGERVWPLE